MSGTYEFYAPFAHIPGRYEVARIHTTTHGSFDTFIVIKTTTDQPVIVYVNSDEGERFMAERYPESVAVRVAPHDLIITESSDGNLVRGVLGNAPDVREPAAETDCADLTFQRVGTALPVATPYGGDGFSVWGSEYTCSGVDMEVPATVNGYVALGAAARAVERFSEEPGIITRGSYGVITAI